MFDKKVYPSTPYPVPYPVFPYPPPRRGPSPALIQEQMENCQLEEALYNAEERLHEERERHKRQLRIAAKRLKESKAECLKEGFERCEQLQKAFEAGQGSRPAVDGGAAAPYAVLGGSSQRLIEGPPPASQRSQQSANSKPSSHRDRRSGAGVAPPASACDNKVNAWLENKSTSGASQRNAPTPTDQLYIQGRGPRPEHSAPHLGSVAPCSLVKSFTHIYSAGTAHLARVMPNVLDGEYCSDNFLFFWLMVWV